MEDDKSTLVEERQEFMIAPTYEQQTPNNNNNVVQDFIQPFTLRNAYFLTPTFDPSNQPLPKHPFVALPIAPNLHNYSVKQRVVFKGVQKSPNSWKLWVETLEKTHDCTWKKAGIFDAIRGSTYDIKLDDDLIIGLVEFWCFETNTFIFPWGEVTITLEDVIILGGFSVLGSCVRNVANDEEIQRKLNFVCAKIKKKSGVSQVSHNGWMKYFKGKGDELEHIGLLVLWLSRFVCSSFNVFSIAVNLARGVRVALAPVVLAAIYRDLRLLKEKILSFKANGLDDGSRLVLSGPLHLVQVWAWERFMALAPKPVSLVRGEPRLARWHGVGKSRNVCLRQEIESCGDEFFWRPYALCVENWVFPKFYCDEGKWVIDSEVDDELLSFARCLRVSELIGLDCVEQYLPHRVAMQFGFDQDVPIFIPRLNGDVDLAWSSYDKPLDGLRLYLPHRLFEGDVTERYCDWWRTQMSPHGEVPRMVNLQRRHLRKVKTLSEILHGGEDETFQAVNSQDMGIRNLSSCESDDTHEDLVISLLLNEEDNSKKNESKAVEEDKENEINTSKFGLSSENSRISGNAHSGDENALRGSQENEVMNLDLVQSIGNVPNPHTASCEGSAPQIFENEAINAMAMAMNVENTWTELEHRENLKDEAMKIEKKKMDNTNDLNKVEGSKYIESTNTRDEKLAEENGTSNGAGPLIDPTTNISDGVQEEDVQHEAREDSGTQKMGTSVHIVIVSDDEDEGYQNPFEARYLNLKTRINRLQKMVSFLKEAKRGP